MSVRLYMPDGRPMHLICFASGKGTTIQALTEKKSQLYKIVAIFVDRICDAFNHAPKGAAAICIDYKQFQKEQEHGLTEEELLERYEIKILTALDHLNIPIDHVALLGYELRVTKVLKNRFPNQISRLHSTDFRILNDNGTPKYAGGDGLKRALQDRLVDIRPSIVLEQNQMVLMVGLAMKVDDATKEAIESKDPEQIQKAVDTHHQRQKELSEWAAVRLFIERVAEGHIFEKGKPLHW